LAQTPQAFGTVRSWIFGMAEIRTVTTLRHKRDEIGASVANYAAGKTLVQRR